jgi:hypothetical protein
MIINYPTGLYDTFNNLENQPNITWYISNNIPPRSKDTVIKIPVAEELQKRKNLAFDDKTRRQTFGNLIFSIEESNNTISESNTKTLAEGDILDFEVADTIDLMIPRNNKIEFRHNSNELNYETMGLNNQEIDDLQSSIFDKNNELNTQFITLRQEITDIEIEISELQKNTNEVTKAINAVTLINDDDLLHKLNIKKTEYKKITEELTLLHNEKTIELGTLVNNITSMNMVTS